MCVYRNGRRKVYTRVCARVREKTKGRRGGGGGGRGKICACA